MKHVDISDKNNKFLMIKILFSDCCKAQTKNDAQRAYPICSKCQKVCGYLKKLDNKS